MLAVTATAVQQVLRPNSPHRCPSGIVTQAGTSTTGLLLAGLTVDPAAVVNVLLEPLAVATRRCPRGLSR
jgi:hypothetical protein